MNKISESFLKINTNLDIDIGNDFRNYIPDKNNLFYRYFLKSIEGESNTVEIPYQNLYRPTIWHETKFNPVYTEDKQLIGVSIFAKDITDKKNIELSLKESEDRFQVIVEKNIAGIFILQNNILIYTNPVFAKTFGFDSKSKVPITLFESFIYKDDLNIFYDLINSEDKNLEPKQTVIRILNPIGKLLYFELMLTSISFNAEQAYVGMMIDVTERTGQETRINEAIILAQENERLQIGMELHDNIKQIISGISMYLDIGLKKLDDKESLKKILLDLKKHNDLASIELRRLSHELAPMLDESSNFTDKIEWLIESLKLRENITVVVKIDEYKQPISNKIQLAFYRILQEQLGNIMRYSKAKKISITLKKFKNKIYFKIKDNGIGFDMQSIKMGIGLENIKRRAKILNGTSKINTMLGKGCEIIISVPNIEN
jgi:PAS domain S-box-containing protein